MSVQRIAFVLYPVSDVAGAAAFYEDILGLKRDPDASGERWIEFDIAGTAFAITNVMPDAQPGSGRSLALEVDDLTAFRATLAQRGLTSPHDFESPVCWMAPVSDPDGNEIILHQLKPHAAAP